MQFAGQEKMLHAPQSEADQSRFRICVIEFDIYIISYPCCIQSANHFYVRSILHPDVNKPSSIAAPLPHLTLATKSVFLQNKTLDFMSMYKSSQRSAEMQ